MDGSIDRSIERGVYVVLVKDLSRDPSECLHIIGLWLWLSTPAIIKNILALPLFIINELVDEAVKCLECLNPQVPEPSSAIEIRPISKPRVRFNAERSGTQLTQDLLHTNISLQYLRSNRTPSVRSKTWWATCASQRSRICSREPATANFVIALPAVPPPEFLALGNRVPGWNVDIDRTLFVTFTWGSKVEVQELAGFFERAFRCVVEMIDLHVVSSQPLYARVVLSGPVTMSCIMEDDNRVKCIFNGNDVWIRRYVPRRD